MSMRAAYVNAETGIVEGIIMVDSLDDVVPSSHCLVALPLVIAPNNNEIADLTTILKQIDPNYQPAPEALVELPLSPGSTKWSQASGFTDLDGNPLA